MWPFSRKAGRAPPPARDGGDRVADLAFRLSQEGRVGDTERELERLDLATLTPEELESWHHVWGTRAFQRGDFSLALARFEEAFEKFPGSGQIAYSLGQEYERLGRTDEAFALFDRFMFPVVPARYAMFQALYAYLWDDLDRAVGYVSPILTAYEELGTVDDHALWQRGLPVFSETFGTIATCHAVRGHHDEIGRLIDWAESKLSDYDYAFLRFELSCEQSGDFRPLLDKLEPAIAQARTVGESNGHVETLCGVLKAQAAATARDAVGCLEDIRLSEGDFPWLPDIATLARAQVAHRFGDVAGEERECAKFFARQPRLMEPHHAHIYNLHDYQERLKPLYRQGHTAAR